MDEQVEPRVQRATGRPRRRQRELRRRRRRHSLNARSGLLRRHLRRPRPLLPGVTIRPAGEAVGWLPSFSSSLGVVLLVQNVSGKADFLHNWWALFILIPAIGSFAKRMERVMSMRGGDSALGWSGHSRSVCL